MMHGKGYIQVLESWSNPSRTCTLRICDIWWQVSINTCAFLYFISLFWDGRKKIFYYCGRLREFWVDFSVWNSLSFSNFSFSRFLFRDHYQEMFYNEIFLIILWLNLVLISYTFNDHVITFIIDYGLLMSSLPLSLSLIWKKKFVKSSWIMSTPYIFT